MERDVKFRGKQKTWIVGGFNKRSDGTCHILTDHESFEVDPKSVGQFIGDGFRDINNQPVIEGDIVNAALNVHGKPTKPQFKAKVIYNSNIGSFQISYKNVNDQFVNDDIWSKYFIEVIGNIYDNPDMI